MLKKIYLLCLLIITISISGCGGISMIQTDKKIYHREFFVDKLTEIKKIYAAGNAKKSIHLLKQLNNTDLLPVEVAMKRNLLGVISFSQKQNEQAIKYFISALTNSSIDPNLTAQIYLNLASTHYLMNMYDRAYSELILGQPSYLEIMEQRKYYKLMFETAKQRMNDKDIIYSLTYYLGTYSVLGEIKTSVYYETLRAYFGKFKLREKMHYFDKFAEKNYFIVGYLAYLQAEELYYQGDKDSANDLISWIQDQFEKNEELLQLTKLLQNKKTNLSPINKKRIAVVLPFTDKKKKFSERVLLGIEFYLKQHNLDYELIIKDSKGSPSVGAQMVEDAIIKDNVAAVIGGLFSAEAEHEYLAAKKEGAVFISLSQVFLAAMQKDHSLIEVPGSIESQLDSLFTPGFLDTFGRRAILLYPNTDKGKTYAHRFWEMAVKNGVTIKSIQTYEKGNIDFRVPVKRMLGLGYPRQRREELDTLKSIYSLEKSSSIKRIQFLGPQVDFDWAFLPISPKDALQVIPSFSYYDAFKLKLIGTPEWRSKRLFGQSRKLGSLYFLGADLNSSVLNMESKFQNQYKRRLGLVEVNSLLAVKIADQLLSAQDNGENRMSFDLFLKNLQEVNIGETSWRSDRGIWIKNMNLLELRRGKTTKVDFSVLPKIEQLSSNEDTKENITAPKAVIP